MLVPMNDVNPYAAAAHIEVLPLTPTRQSIERALVEWMTQTGRPASDLSVSALCKKAFVARSTFYANYRHMGQVYESVENRLLRQLFECAVPMRVRADGTDETMRSFNAFVKVLHAHENEFRLVLVRQPSSRFVALWKQSLEYHVWHRLFETERGGAAAVDAVAEWGDGAAPGTANGGSATSQEGLPAGTEADATNRNELPVRQGPATVNRALVFDMAATAFIAGVTFWLRTPQAVSLPEIRASVVKLVNNIDEIW